MTLTFYAQKCFSGWMPTAIFQSLYDYYKPLYNNLININNDTINYCTSNGPAGPQHLIIKNESTKKYKVVTYCDIAHTVLDDQYGWENSNCCGVYSAVSAGSHRGITPASYSTYSTDVELAINNCNKCFLNKTNKTLLFRGYLYGLRYSMSNLNKYKNIITIKDKKITYKKYINELNSYLIGLSLNGAAEVCNRDMEILGVGSVLLRPKFKTSNFHNSLIAGVHYVSFETDNDPEQQLEIIFEIYNKLIKDIDYMIYISTNGLNWYNKNASKYGNISVLSNIINIEELL